MSDPESLPAVTEIHRWEIKPGDRLIVHVEREIDPRTVEMIQEKARAALALPDDFPVLVTGPGIGVEVASGRV